MKKWIKFKFKNKLWLYVVALWILVGFLSYLMIKDGENGFLVNSVDEFAEKLTLLMKDKDLRIRLGKQAVEDMKPYAPENIMDAWDKLIKETIAPYQK